MSKEKTFSHITSAAIDVALSAGELLRRGFGTSFSISSKEGKHNLVTEYDKLSEKQIIEEIAHRVPNSFFLSEECGAVGSEGEFLWIIDPLDGTVNFAHQIPIFSVSIAAVSAKNREEILCGVVYQPMVQELFVAEKGKGAFLNHQPIHVSPVKDVNQSILAVGFPYNVSENPFHCIDHFIEIAKLGLPIRRLGSGAIDLAYTAAGRFEGFFEVGLSPWDVAAGKLLVQEAGGEVTQWNGTPFSLFEKKPILATNSHIHTQLTKLLNHSS